MCPIERIEKLHQEIYNILSKMKLNLKLRKIGNSMMIAMSSQVVSNLELPKLS
jgi:hypothetical protein